MFGRCCRTIVALAVAPWLAVAAAMPQEHAHEADADHPSVVHRHADSHAVDSHDHDEVAFDHDDVRVVWLSTASLVRSTYHVDVSWAVAGRCVETAPDLATWIATQACDSAPPHGPPRRSGSSRAPPAHSA